MLWSWRADAGVKVAGFFRKRRWQTSPVTWESTKQAVKTIARRMPGDFRCDYARVLCFILHARLRVHRAPGVPCALGIRGQDAPSKTRVHTRRDREAVAAKNA